MTPIRYISGCNPVPRTFRFAVRPSFSSDHAFAAEPER